MYHIIAYLELLQLLKRKRNLTVAGTLTPEVVFVVAVKYLVVCEKTAFEQAVGKTFVKGFTYCSKLEVLATLRKYVMQTVTLLWIIGKDI
jgi:hypothetical protein